MSVIVLIASAFRSLTPAFVPPTMAPCTLVCPHHRPSLLATPVMADIVRIRRVKIRLLIRLSTLKL